MVHKMVGTETLLALATVHQRVMKIDNMPTGLPDSWRHQNGRIQAHDVTPVAHHRRPPCLLHIALQLDAERAIVPSGGEAAIDLATGEDEPPSLRE